METQSHFSTLAVQCQILKNEYVTDGGLSYIPGDPPNPAQVAHCIKWLLSHCAPRKTPNLRAFSYRLKHLAENWLSARYCSEGALIAAAISLGIPYRKIYGGNGIWLAVKPAYRGAWEGE